MARREETKSPVILIDVMNAVFRCHWAYPNLSANGESTSVQYGLLKILDNLRESVSKRIVFCWDHGIPVYGAPRPRNWREDVVASYKANRHASAGSSSTKGDDIAKVVFPQLKPLHDIICDLGYCHASVMGLEADDMIGILSRAAKSEVFIFSTDHDFYQLLEGNRVRVLVPKKGKNDYKIISQSDVEREYNFPVSRWAEYLALGGDSSDNIKPMRGMGPKTAQKMIQSGVDLRDSRSFEDQPESFKSSFAKYAEAWPAILKSYHAAKIPTSLSDPRIRQYISDGVVFPIPDQQWSSPRSRESSFKKFVEFCSTRNMVSLLSRRHQLFDERPNEQREQKQPCTSTRKSTRERIRLV